MHFGKQLNRYAVQVFGIYRELYLYMQIVICDNSFLTTVKNPIELI